jgi:hypothetical protein
MPQQRTIPRVCAQCGEPFFARAADVKAGGANFCSLSCSVKFTRAKQWNDPSRFWSQVDKSDGCWLWTGSRFESGYGRVNWKAQTYRSHRFAWELATGNPPGDLLILHTCDNPLCVRNDDEGVYYANGAFHLRRGHLWLGANDDNMADMVAKGRAKGGNRITDPTHVPRGERHSHAKLTDALVREIRAVYDAGETNQTVLGKRFGVSHENIYRIVRRRSWKHVV